MHLNVLYAKYCPFCRGLNVLSLINTVGELCSTLRTKTTLIVRSGSYIKQMPLEHIFQGQSLK